jgi:hypothetical protein
MDDGGSLDAGHGRLSDLVQSVIAAGKGRRWADYRLQLGLLRDGLACSPACEDETLRQHLETLVAAAPEQDPEGCLRELGVLGELLRIERA